MTPDFGLKLHYQPDGLIRWLVAVLAAFLAGLRGPLRVISEIAGFLASLFMASLFMVSLFMADLVGLVLARLAMLAALLAGFRGPFRIIGEIA
jgi:hypothetical protein